MDVSVDDVSVDEVVGRIEYGSAWRNLSATEQDTIFEQVILQADAIWCRDNIHSMIAEWINENYRLYLEVERYDPDQEISELEDVEVKVRTTQHGHSVYLDVPHDRQTVAKKSYIGTPDWGYVIDDVVEDFAVNHELFNRGVLDEVETDNEIDPDRLRGLDEYIYKRVGEDFGERYIRTLKDGFSDFIVVRKRKDD